MKSWRNSSFFIYIKPWISSVSVNLYASETYDIKDMVILNLCADLRSECVISQGVIEEKSEKEIFALKYSR